MDESIKWYSNNSVCITFLWLVCTWRVWTGGEMQQARLHNRDWFGLDGCWLDTVQLFSSVSQQPQHCRNCPFYKRTRNIYISNAPRILPNGEYFRMAYSPRSRLFNGLRAWALLPVAVNWWLFFSRHVSLTNDFTAQYNGRGVYARSWDCFNFAGSNVLRFCSQITFS